MSASAAGGSYSTNSTAGFEGVRVAVDSNGGIVSLGGKNKKLTGVIDVTEDGKIRVVADEVYGASRSWDVSVPSSGWHASTATWPEAGLTAKWETTIAVPGMVAQMNSAMTTHTGGTVAAYGQWRWLDTAADAVTLYSDNTSVPTAAFTLRITEVR